MRQPSSLPSRCVGTRPRFGTSRTQKAGDPPLESRAGVSLTATVRRALPPKTSATAITEKSSQKSYQKSYQKILALISENSEISSRELATHLGITERAVKKQIATLKATGKLRSVGPDKGGHWEVVNL